MQQFPRNIICLNRNSTEKLAGLIPSTSWRGGVGPNALPLLRRSIGRIVVALALDLFLP